MKKSSLYKLSFIGIALMTASAVIAAILPKKESKKFFNGIQAGSTNWCIGQITCVNGSGAVNCTFTVASYTTTNANIPGRQTNGTSAVNIGSSAVIVNSSQSPC